MARDISTVTNLAKNIEAYVNYDSAAEKAAKEERCMKESKDFYADNVLKGVAQIFADLSLEEISAILIECAAYADVKDPQE